MNYKLTRIALLSAFATLMFIIESLIPMPMPWFRLGLANLFSLLALKWWGFREGVLITCIRIIIGHLLIGRFLTPGFILSLGGGLSAVIAMHIAIKTNGTFFSLIGISILGASIHNWIQLILVQILLIKQLSLFYFFPILTIIGIITGILTGSLAQIIHKKFRILH